MATIEGQQVALGNLGKIGSHSFADQPDKLQQFIESYIDLSKQNNTSNVDAHIRLGEILISKGDYESSANEFFKAMADQNIEKDEKNEVMVNYGMATGNLTWNQKQQEIQQTLNAFRSDPDEA